MATMMNKGKNEYCDEVLSEIAYMIQNIHELRKHAEDRLGKGADLAKAHERHLTEIADYLDWKLQILTSACPFDWKGLDEGVERVVSVGLTDTSGPEFSGGYVGG